MSFSLFKKIISEREFKYVCSHLYHHGMSEHDVDEIRTIFETHLNDPHRFRGMDKKDVTSILDWMRENKNDHNLSSDQIDSLEAELYKYL
ncbi:MAG: hypothetical protein WC797_04850 [Candidatus Paceibacterota bacterium]|jgi:hypothetical protein